jgi:hypothetical protein
MQMVADSMTTKESNYSQAEALYMRALKVLEATVGGNRSGVACSCGVRVLS